MLNKSLIIRTLGLMLLSSTGCLHIQSPEEKQQNKVQIAVVQSAVTRWIENHAQHPSSYESISFSDYSEYSSKRNDLKIPGSEKYVIRHRHKILDTDSILRTFDGYFILDNKLDITEIEINRSNSMGGGFPPRTSVWLNEYGRPLNAQDSLEMRQKQKQTTDKFIQELKDGIENGNLQSESPGGMQVIINLIDTLEGKE